jgi:hypothetical protein
VDEARWRLLILALAVLGLGAAIAVGVVVSDGTGLDDELAHSKPAHERPQLAPGVKRCPRGSEHHTLPAHLLGGNASPISVSSEILIPVNSWSVGDCHGITSVYAGAAGWRNATGIFVIERRRGQHLRNRYIVVPDSGATKITHAPTGPKVITSAQHRGELKFTSRRGATGTVNLADDTATLSTGEVIHARDRPFSYP